MGAEGLGARVERALCGLLVGAVVGTLHLPFQNRGGLGIPAMGVDVPEARGVLKACFNVCFWFSLIAVSCRIARSSFHWATGNLCFADRARIVARTLVFEASAASIAILN